MVAMLGIGVGLAATRLPGARWFDGLLGAFLAWYIIGCWSQAAILMRSTALQVKEDAGAIRLAIVARQLAPLVVAFGIALLLARRSGMDSLKFDDFGHSQALHFVSTGLIVLPILALLPRAPSRQIVALRGRIGRFLRGFLAMLSGTALTLIVGTNLVLITVLVHIAIHGVRQLWPMRRQGVQYGANAFDADATWLFNWGSVVAVILWLLAVACLWRFAHLARLQSPVRWRLTALVSIFVAILGCLAGFIVAGGWLFVTRISPILGPFIWNQKPPLLWWLGTLSLATAAGWMTALLLRTSTESEVADSLHVPLPFAPQLHDRLPVLLLPAIWWLFDLGESIQQLIPLRSLLPEMVTLVLGDVSVLFFLAYCLSWLQVAWQRWKGYDASRLVLARVAAWQVAVIWLASALVILTGGPVAAWISFALWTWPA